jgi:hypothetical protein
VAGVVTTMVSFGLRLACLIHCTWNSKQTSGRCARTRGVRRCQSEVAGVLMVRC